MDYNSSVCFRLGREGLHAVENADDALPELLEHVVEHLRRRLEQRSARWRGLRADARHADPRVPDLPQLEGDAAGRPPARAEVLRRAPVAAGDHGRPRPPPPRPRVSLAARPRPSLAPQPRPLRPRRPPPQTLNANSLAALARLRPVPRRPRPRPRTHVYVTYWIQ